MAESNTGFINLVGSILTHTLDGKCHGSILQTNVTGGTAPYTVSWSGVSNFSATTFDVVTDKGVYQGGVIAPGVNLSIKSLTRSADQIPIFSLSEKVLIL